MPKYLVYGTYTEEGLKGVLEDGGTKRRDVAPRLVESLGGTMEAFYFAFGHSDLYVIADLPDNVSMVALSGVVAAAGGFSPTTVVLLTPEEIDAAVEKSAEYTPPGE
jgi:uncharacterized protein with GYD domain